MAKSFQKIVTPRIFTKHAMFRTIHLQTIDVGHAHIPYTNVSYFGLYRIVSQIMLDVIPLDTSTATMGTTNLVSGMFRHHSRMVPVATLARNLIIYKYHIVAFKIIGNENSTKYTSLIIRILERNT